MIRSFIALGGIVALGLVALGCRMLGPTVEARGDFSYSKPIAGKSELTLDNINGTITIIGVEGLNEVQITGVKIVKSSSVEDARDHLEDIRIDVKESGSTITVATDQPNGGFSRSYAVNYEIKVPSGWKVAVDNTNGNVDLNNMKNAIKASITNGDLNGKNIAASIDADVVNGRIAGEMKLPENGSCKLSTTNGAIDTKMEIPATASAHMETVNGTIRLAVPKSTSAKVTAESTTGDIDVHDLAFSAMKQSDDLTPGETLTGTLGSGGGTIDLDVTNGEIGLSGY